jgi:hypothetical protein
VDEGEELGIVGIGEGSKRIVPSTRGGAGGPRVRPSCNVVESRAAAARLPTAPPRHL